MLPRKPQSLITSTAIIRAIRRIPQARWWPNFVGISVSPLICEGIPLMRKYDVLRSQRHTYTPPWLRWVWILRQRWTRPQRRLLCEFLCRRRKTSVMYRKWIVTVSVLADDWPTSYAVLKGNLAWLWELLKVSRRQSRQEEARRRDRMDWKVAWALGASDILTLCGWDQRWSGESENNVGWLPAILLRKEVKIILKYSCNKSLSETLLKSIKEIAKSHITKLVMESRDTKENENRWRIERSRSVVQINEAIEQGKQCRKWTGRIKTYEGRMK